VGQATDENVLLTHCMLETSLQIHTHTGCIRYFSTATMVAGMRLIIM